MKIILTEKQTKKLLDTLTEEKIIEESKSLFFKKLISKN